MEDLNGTEWTSGFITIVLKWDWTTVSWLSSLCVNNAGCCFVPEGMWWREEEMVLEEKKLICVFRLWYLWKCMLLLLKVVWGMLVMLLLSLCLFYPRWLGLLNLFCFSCPREGVCSWETKWVFYNTILGTGKVGFTVLVWKDDCDDDDQQRERETDELIPWGFCELLAAFWGYSTMYPTDIDAFLSARVNVSCSLKNWWGY